MPALLTELIDKRDTSEIVRDQIAAILAVESERQRELAEDADPAQDPSQWALQVFLERSDPWSAFQEHPASVAPIVAVSLESLNYDKVGSVVDNQPCTGTFHVDCYGYGKAADVQGGGHIPGDEMAALEAQRAVRLVRNILMSGHYTYLAMRKTVEQRWLRDVRFLDMPLAERPTTPVVAARMVFEVKFRETSPQVQGVTMTELLLTAKRASTGQIYFAAEYSGGDS